MEDNLNIIETGRRPKFFEKLFYWSTEDFKKDNATRNIKNSNKGCGTAPGKPSYNIFFK